MIVTGTQNTKKHGGRPTVAEARRLSKAVTVKFSQKDYEILMYRSKKANKHMAEYIRDSALYTDSMSPNWNLNQLTKMAHQDGIFYLYSPLDSLLSEITNVIRTYRQDTNKRKK